MTYTLRLRQLNHAARYRPQVITRQGTKQNVFAIPSLKIGTCAMAESFLNLPHRVSSNHAFLVMPNQASTARGTLATTHLQLTNVTPRGRYGHACNELVVTIPNKKHIASPPAEIWQDHSTPTHVRVHQFAKTSVEMSTLTALSCNTAKLDSGLPRWVSPR